MNCSQARDLLPGLVYGDLPAHDATTLQDHLGSCSACQRELAALKGVGRMLDSVPAAAVDVDFKHLYRQAAELSERRRRRWRRAAPIVFGAAATVMVLIAGAKLEVRVESHQLVVRWGDVPPPAVPSPFPQQPPSRTEERPENLIAHQMADQVQLHSALLEGQQEDVARLQTQLAELKRQLSAAGQRWLTTERDVAALSSNYPLPMTKGDSHE
jgi:hypothetical protein